MFQHPAASAFRAPVHVAPLSLASCVAYFDMLTVASYTVDTGPAPDEVTSITNRVSSVAMNTHAGDYPEYEAAGLNGRPCMRGNVAATRGLISTEAAVVAPFIGEDRPWSMIVVWEPAGVEASSQYYWGVGNSATSAYYGSRQSGGGSPEYRDEIRSDAAQEVSQGADQPVVVPQVLCLRNTGTAMSRHRNLDQTYAGAASNIGTVTVDRFGLFCLPNAGLGSHSACRVGAYLLFNECLSEANRAGITVHLMRLWGL
jgi:hypothetical protein